MPLSQDGRHERICARDGCDVKFNPKKISQEFCSQACSNKAFPGTGGRKATPGLEERTCAAPDCGVRFQPYRASQTTHSVKCYKKLPRVRERENSRHALPEVRDRKNEQRRTDPKQVARIRSYNRKVQLARYGLTPEEFDAKLEAQGGMCAVCGKPPKPDGIRAASQLHQDHDHLTGLNRDLLCSTCNYGLGQFKDDPALLRAAADYIDRHRARMLITST